MTCNDEDFADVVKVLKAGYAADPLPRSLRDGVLRKLDALPVRRRQGWAGPLLAAALFLGGLIALVAFPPGFLRSSAGVLPAAQESDAQRLEQLTREITRLKEEIRTLEEEIARSAKRPPAPPTVPAGGASQIRVTAIAASIGLVVISAGKDDGVLEGGGYSVFRNGEVVARIVIDRADRKWSAGKVVFKVADPQVGDSAEPVR